MSTDFKTPIGAVRGLGAARAGTEHHIRQRVSAIALVFLVPWFLYAVIAASRSGFEGATAFLSQPWNAILMILALGAAFYHMRIGMQVIIEDYIHGEAAKLTTLILVKLAVYLTGACAVFAVIRLTFGS